MRVLEVLVCLCLVVTGCAALARGASYIQMDIPTETMVVFTTGAVCIGAAFVYSGTRLIIDLIFDWRNV